MIVLYSILASYETFVDTLLYGKETISLDDVSSALKSKELKRNFSDGKDASEGEGMMVRRRSQQRDKKFEARTNCRAKMTLCYDCRECGHRRRDCLMLGKD